MPEVSLKDALSEIVFSCRVLSQGRDATIAEIEGFLSGPLATAVARARREALEEARACIPFDVGEYSEYGAGLSAAIKEMETALDLLLARAATPPEARQTETGWKTPVGWKLVPEEPTEEMLSAMAFWTDDGPRVSQLAWEGALNATPAPPPPAIGNLDREGRS